MLADFFATASDFLGLRQEDLTLGQSVIRAAVVYAAAIFLVRLGEKRFMGKNTAFDVILGIILGSVLSRGITGDAPFFNVLSASAALVLLHWLFSVITYYSDSLGSILKGRERKLVDNGRIVWENMRKSHLTFADLMGALRTNGSVTAVEDVSEAHFERSGDISVVKKKEK